MAPEHLAYWKAQASVLTDEELAQKISESQYDAEADPLMYPTLVEYGKERLALFQAEQASRTAKS